MTACPQSPLPLGVVRDLLATVDCHVQVYSAAGYLALTGPRSPLPAAMTALLTIYVALLGYRLLTGVGGTRLSQTPLIAVKIGVVLAVTLNWSVFQTLVFNLAADAPMQIGRVIARPMAGAGGTLAADPVLGLQTAYDEFTADAEALGKKAAQGAVVQAAVGPPTNGLAAGGGHTNEAATASGLRRASAALLASTVGVLASAFIVVGVLTAVGPLFIALFLFEATRGFFVGWVRALVGAMLVPTVCWFTTSLLLVILSPRIDTLAQERAAGAIDLDTAAAAAALVLVFAASQALLIVAALLAASGFRLGRSARAAPIEIAPAAPTVIGAEVIEGPSRAQVLAGSLRRSAVMSSRQDVAGGFVLAGAPGETGRDGAIAESERSRPTRLGETYRRGAATRERARPGGAVRT